VPHSIPSRVSTCIIFTCSQTSHMMYHVISFDLLTSHVTSHMTKPDTQLLTPAFPLWFTDTITRLGWLPNWDIGSTSYLGNTPVRNSRTWTTERHGDLTMTVTVICASPSAAWCPQVMPITCPSLSFACCCQPHGAHERCPSPTCHCCLHVAIGCMVPTSDVTAPLIYLQFTRLSVT